MLRNSVAYSAGTIVRLSIGFLTWLAAARLYPTAEVGIAAVLISTMSLCVQVGGGLDLALVALFPEYRQRPALLLDSSFSLAIAVGCLACLGCIALAAIGLDALHVLAASFVYAMLFVLLTVLQACWWLMDQAAVALRRSDQVLLRAVVAGVLTLAGVVAFGAAGLATAREILGAWVGAALAACVIGLVQISRATGGYRFRPRLPRPMAKRLLSVGLPNFALTAADNAPGLILPIVVAGALSARAAAFWYVAWMMALAAYTVPISFGLHLFAEISETPLELVRHLRDSLRLGIPVAGAATVGLVTLGPLVLSILGSGYADQGSTPLRLVALAAMPMVVTKSYLAVCRGTGRIREGTIVAGMVGTAAVCLALGAAQAFGLSGIAAAWLTVQVIAALGAAIRLRTLAWLPSRRSEATYALSTGAGS